ncbi:mitochondrial inner membrane protein required for protein import [Physocladia obscura]|uniref:Mitochondrial import inner membrane translocase subunit TIM50 n=1 Tax=Physocladia obscura TaxID=109957 RepID=A0AAD5T785_9FUNG|nr:mitochondrial inner membrane protein required for protein import [Physocladia obscura]
MTRIVTAARSFVRIASANSQRCVIQSHIAIPALATVRSFSSASPVFNTSNSNNSNKDSDDGMDLFARALKAQKAKQQHEQQQPQQQSDASSSAAEKSKDTTKKLEQDAEPDLDEEISPEEEERRRRWKEQTEEQERKKMAKGTRGLGLITAASLTAGYIYMGLATNDDNESGLTAHHNRVRKYLNLGAKSIVEPPSVKLLPDVLPDPYQRPYTLCLELNDSLVHLVWDKDYGWRIATRPGVKQFISYLSRYFEIVIFTTSLNYVAQPVIETLDPYHYIMYSLYRDSTRLMGIKHVKDLSCLNRDLGKIIVVDTDPENFQLQPENGIQLKAWKGEEGDMELAKLMKVLEEMALLATVVNLSDLRPLLKSFKSLSSSPDDPWSGWLSRKEQLRADFAESERKTNGESYDDIKVAADAKTTSTFVSMIASSVGALFGRGISTPQQAGNTHQPGSNVSGSSLKRTNLIDLIEHAAKEEYGQFLKEQTEQVKQMEEAKKKHEEEQMAQLQAMKEKKLKLFDYMMGAGNPDVAQQNSQSAATPAAGAA